MRQKREVEPTASWVGKAAKGSCFPFPSPLEVQKVSGLSEQEGLVTQKYFLSPEIPPIRKSGEFQTRCQMQTPWLSEVMAGHTRFLL